MKPLITYADMKWHMDFEKVKAFGTGARIGPYEILWINEEPPWIQFRVGRHRQMVRKGDPFPKELL